MAGGRQARHQAARRTITPSHHHHQARLHSSSRTRPRSVMRTPDHKKSERPKARHEVWAARKKLQLQKEDESLEASPVASLLLPEDRLWPDLDDLFDDINILRFRWNYTPILWPPQRYLRIVEPDSLCFDDSRSEEWLDALDQLFDEN